MGLFTVKYRTHVEWVLPLRRDAVSVFYSPSRLEWKLFLNSDNLRKTTTATCRWTRRGTPHGLKTVNSIEKIQPRIMYVTIKDNPSTTIVSGYSSTNTNKESNITTFYKGLSFITRHIPKLSAYNIQWRHGFSYRQNRK